MSRNVKALHWSLAIHMVLALAILTTGRTVPPPIKITWIDLGLINMEDIEPDRVIAVASQQSNKPTTKQPVQPSPQKQRKSRKNPVTPRTTQTMNASTSLSPLPSPILHQPEQQDQKSENANNEEVVATNPVAPASAVHASTASITGKPGQREAGIQEQYLTQHFIYIRDQIMHHLSYPAIARKKGWAGQVKLSFRIIEDGTVEAIKVVTSSGFPILDRDAVDTVNKVAPFPRPPARADITIPITYALRH